MTFPKYLLPIGFGLASLATQADSPLPVQHSDEGSSTYVASAASMKATGSERSGVQALNVDPAWIASGDSWEPRQHAYTFSGGRLTHADNIEHNTPRPPVPASTERLEYDKDK